LNDVHKFLAMLASRPMVRLGILPRKTEMLAEENWIPIVRVAGVLRTRRVLSGDELNELLR
jgi:hypothetical protein